MSKSKNHLEKFKSEVSSSLVLNGRTKAFWLSKADKMPPEVIRLLYGRVKMANDRIRRYVMAAVKKDPEALNKITQKMKKIEHDILALEEADSKPLADEMLKKELEDV
jgi:hypothetical protein